MWYRNIKLFILSRITQKLFFILIYIWLLGFFSSSYDNTYNFTVKRNIETREWNRMFSICFSSILDSYLLSIAVVVVVYSSGNIFIDTYHT